MQLKRIPTNCFPTNIPFQVKKYPTFTHVKEDKALTVQAYKRHMNYSEVLKQVAGYVKKYMQQHHNPALLYHDLEHTESVVAAAYQICSHYPLNETEQFIVITAAWFHDVGYLQDIHQHEVCGALHAGDFLEKAGVDADTIHAVRQCILATQMPQNAVTLPEQILCDADMFHLGTNEFEENSKLLRREKNNFRHIPISKDEWRTMTIDLLKNHTYYTEYCRVLLQEKKAQNLEKLIKKANEQQQVPEESAEAYKIKKKYEGPERTIETMFRITSTNSQKLSDQADTKAHILITVNSIIVSVLLTVFVRKENDYASVAAHLGIMAIPLSMLLVVNLVTIIFSILTTRPNVPNGTFTPEGLKKRSVNLLFFGNFYRMKFDDYSDGMFQIMRDKNYLHTTLLRDIYLQGVVLGRKYRMLKIAYNVFMYGLVVSVMVFFMLAIAHSDAASTQATDSALPYRLDSPNTVRKLPPALREISGLSLAADDRQLLTVNDEQGIIFFINRETGVIERQIDFKDKGDFEGIEAVGKDVFVVNSDGTLYQISDSGSVKTFTTGLSTAYNVEGLAYDPKHNRLLLACKDLAGEGDEFKYKKAVYAFDLKNQRLEETPAFLIDRNEIAQWKGRTDGLAEKWNEYFSSSHAASAFNPSGIAFCPQDSLFYVLASAGKSLAALREDGSLAFATRLDPKVFHQPEGICFDIDGNLYIASEGGATGQLLRFNRRTPVISSH